MSTTIQKARGVVALVGPHVDDLARQALRSLTLADIGQNISLAPAPYHITLLTKDETRGFSEEQLSGLPSDIGPIYAIGVGRCPQALFVVVTCAAGQQLRKQLRLPPKQFHITLSTSDSHDVDKGIDSLLPGQFPESPDPGMLDHLAFTLQISGQHEKAQAFSVDLIKALPDSHRGFLRLADAALWADQHKLAILSYACAFQRTDDTKVQDYCIKKMIECSRGTEWGTALLDAEKAQIHDKIASLLLVPWSQELRLVVCDAAPKPTLCVESRERLLIPSSHKIDSETGLYQRLPRFFRWLVPFKIAIMSTPRDESDILTLASPHLGIRCVLTLTEEEPLRKEWFRAGTIKNIFLPLPNFHPPSLEQMDLIMRLVNEEENIPMLVHCGGGKGRAGTVAACYLVAYGFGSPRVDLTTPSMSPSEAISCLRAIRPGSIETERQEAFVAKWSSTIWKRQCILQELVSEPVPCPVEIEGALGTDCNLFMLVGLPGSGKSWFCNALLARNLKGWNRISQDDSRSRSACETEIGRARGRVLLDRCNTSSSDRKLWLDLASNWVAAPVCIWFDYESDLCTSRAQNRIGHPTLPPGSRVRNAVDQMLKILVRPTLKEGFKAVVVIRSFAAAQEMILRLSPPVLFKFPRTPHILNLGAATSDDILTEIPAIPDQAQVVITEKVDGANMGFSLSADRSQIIVQNRSHYVNPATHEQFKKLGLWLDRHREDLFKVLDRDRHFAERYILFGEWLFATHSIPYTHLPDRFMAFDIYDRSTGQWADRDTLSGLLNSTSIPLVPVLYQGKMPVDAQLRNMVQTQSQFWDGRLEGVYIKVERNGVVISRGKIVRADFIAGNEHWTKGNLRVNGLEGEGREL